MDVLSALVAAASFAVSEGHFPIAPGPAAPSAPGFGFVNPGKHEHHDSCVTWNVVQWRKVLVVPVAMLLITLFGVGLWLISSKIITVRQPRKHALIKRKGSPRDKLQRNVAQHVVFWSNVRQAVTIGLWVAIVGLPIYTEAPRRHFFGMEKCGDISGFAYAHRPQENRTAPYVSHFKPYKHGDWNGDSPGYDGEGQIWCGLLPRAYASAWPSIASTMIYQVQKDTGSTVKSFYGVCVGAFWAAANLQLLNFLFPMGPRPNSIGMAFVWADFMALVMVAMVSTADLWTRKFFLVHHCSFIMDFINPKVGFSLGSERTMLFRGIDEVTVKIFVILLASAICSVLTTIIPYPLLNITKVQQDSQSCVDDKCDLFSGGLQYFRGKACTAKRFQLGTKAFGFRLKALRVKSNLDSAWWETFDFGNTKCVRALYGFFDECICGPRAQLYLLDFGQSIVNLKFNSDEKNKIAKELYDPLESLQREANTLLNFCSDFCRDGIIDPDEKKKLEGLEETITKIQKDAVEQYRKYMNTSEAGFDLPDEAAFASAVSRRCLQVVRMSKSLRNWEAPKPENILVRAKTLGKVVIKRIQGAFVTKDMFDKGNLSIAVRNSAALAGAFLAGRYFDWGNLFFPYTKDMPTALCLLINVEAGTQTKAGFNRMLGITLGNLIPMLTVACLTAEVLMEQPLLRVPLHFAMIVIYTSVFAYLAYSSKSYDMVGLFSAGFGMTKVFGTLKLFEKGIGGEAEGLSGPELETGYRGLLLLSVVIVWQSVTGMIGGAFHSKSTRMQAIEKITAVCTFFEDNMKAFFAEVIDDPGVKVVSIQEMFEELSAARDMIPLLHPTAEVSPGMQADFKVDLYTESLKDLSSMIASFQTLVDVCGKDYERFHEKARPEDFTPVRRSSRPSYIDKSKCEDFTPELRRMAEWQGFLEEVTTQVSDCCEVLREVITQDTDSSKVSDILKKAEEQNSNISCSRNAHNPFQMLARKAAAEDQRKVPGGLHADRSARALAASAAIHTILRHAVSIEESCVRAHVQHSIR